ncbi:MAG: 5'/3'-nucleotidase SurE, partial [Alphaproteobacteria bacterium]
VAAPAVRGVEVVRQGRFKVGDVVTERIDPRGRTYYWIGEMRNHRESVSGTDTDAVNRGAIAVTPLCLDLTDPATSDRLSEALG